MDFEYFYFNTSPDQNKDLGIFVVGHEKCAQKYDVNRDNYPFFFLKYTIGGKGSLKFNSQTNSLGPGTLTGFAPKNPHHYIADIRDPMEHIFITFHGNQADELFSKSTLAENHLLKVADPQSTLDIFQRALNIGRQKPSFAEEICCHYLHILLLEIAPSSKSIIVKPSIAMQTYNKCKDYIEKNYSLIQSPIDVAMECDIDVRYMASIFKKFSQIPPGQHIMGLKLNKAADLLLNTDYKIKDIAELVGFSNQYHFSKNFKKFHGLSPNHYRTKHI